MYNNKKKFIDSNREPILRGCPNKMCFCTGKCREIIGYREKPKKLIEVKNICFY